MSTDKLKDKILELEVQRYIDMPHSGFKASVTAKSLKFLTDKDFKVSDDGDVINAHSKNGMTLEEFFDGGIATHDYLYTEEKLEERRRANILATDPTKREMDSMSDRSLWSAVPDQQTRHNA